MLGILSKMSNQLILAIDIGGTNIRVGLVTNHGDLINICYLSTKSALKENSPQLLIQSSWGLLKQVGCSKEKLMTIIIGVPCTLNKTRTTILSCPNIVKLQQLDIINAFQQEFRKPIYLERDTNLILLGEHWKGAAVGYSNVAGIFVGTGLGCALILNNQLYKGAHGVAAELGHLRYPGRADICGCGNIGCVELYAGGVALDSAAQKHGLSSTQDIFKQVASGDKFWQSIFDAFLDALAWAISVLVNIIDPDIVVLGGGVIERGGLAVEEIRTRVVKYTRKPEPARSLVITKAMLGDRAALIGSVKYAQECMKGRLTS